MDPHRNNFQPNYNFYGSQLCQQDPYSPAMYPGLITQYSFPIYNPAFVPEQCESTSSTSSTASSPASSTETTTAATNELAKPSRKKYDTWPQHHQKLLVQLWVENHESIESNDSRNAWRQICEEINKRENTSKTVEQCKKKIAYLVDKYKKAKEWNRKQTGGSKRKNPYYDAIDEVLGCRDAVTMDKVSEAGTSSSALDSSISMDEDNECNAGQKEASVEEKNAKRRERKAKKRRTTDSDEDDEERKELRESLKSLKESGNKIGDFMDSFTRAQEQQSAMMNQCLGALGFMAKSTENKDTSSQ